MKFRFPRLYTRRSDIKALAVLLVLAICFAVALLFTSRMNDVSSPVADNVETSKGLVSSRMSDVTKQPYYDQGLPHPERFTFDPNTADSTMLLRLGLPPYMVRSIYKYRAKGGIYRRVEDFARVPGLTQKQYRELKPCISISPDYLPASQLPEARSRDYERDTLLFPRKIGELERITLNDSDTTLLKRVPGIGSYFARAIVNYGQRLGGYVSVDQLDEIEDFPEEAKKYFVVENPIVTRLNVNTLSIQKLKRHPYMGFYRAKAIADYRRLHGPLKRLDDVRLSPDFPPEAIERLRPYVEF